MKHVSLLSIASAIIMSSVYGATVFNKSGDTIRLQYYSEEQYILGIELSSLQYTFDHDSEIYQFQRICNSRDKSNAYTLIYKFQGLTSSSIVEFTVNEGVVIKSDSLVIVEVKSQDNPDWYPMSDDKLTMLPLQYKQTDDDQSTDDWDNGYSCPCKTYCPCCSCTIY